MTALRIDNDSMKRRNFAEALEGVVTVEYVTGDMQRSPTTVRSRRRSEAR